MPLHRFHLRLEDLAAGASGALRQRGQVHLLRGGGLDGVDHATLADAFAAERPPAHGRHLPELTAGLPFTGTAPRSTSRARLRWAAGAHAPRLPHAVATT